MIDIPEGFVFKNRISANKENCTFPLYDEVVNKIKNPFIMTAGGVNKEKKSETIAKMQKISDVIKNKNYIDYWGVGGHISIELGLNVSYQQIELIPELPIREVKLVSITPYDLGFRDFVTRQNIVDAGKGIGLKECEFDIPFSYILEIRELNDNEYYQIASPSLNGVCFTLTNKKQTEDPLIPGCINGDIKPDTSRYNIWDEWLFVIP